MKCMFKFIGIALLLLISVGCANNIDKQTNNTDETIESVVASLIEDAETDVEKIKRICPG